MIISNIKMVEGPPLQYYWPRRRERRDDSFQFFRPFETVSGMMDRPEELMMPSSPASTQSDSDNSVSSVEISPSQIRLTNSIIKSEVQCRWRNCGIHFSTLDQLATHVAKVHSASGLGGLFYCGWDGCPRNDKGFNARYKMLVHVRTHTNEKPHKCPTCSKSFSRAENLKIHSRSHSGEKPYVCPVPGCNKAYSNSSDRFKHTRTHQVEKPYHCKVPGCPKKYTDPSSLRKHVKTYKHFANELEEKANESPSPEGGEESSGRTNCDGLCCVSNRGRLPLQFGGFLDLKADETRSFRFVGYSTFQGCEQPMDLDAPLDLSMHRRNF